MNVLDRLVFAAEDFREWLKKSFWLSVLCTLIILLLWCGLVLYAVRDQSIPIDANGAVAYVRDYIWYWLGAVALWKFYLAFYTLIFVYRNHAVRLRQYFGFMCCGLLALAFLYSFHFALGIIFNLVPLFRKDYLAFLQGATAQSHDERGSTLLSSREAERLYRKLRPRDDAGVLFGGVRIPTTHAVQNFLFIGTIGSGKTISIQLLLQSLLQGETNHESKK